MYTINLCTYVIQKFVKHLCVLSSQHFLLLLSIHQRYIEAKKQKQKGKANFLYSKLWVCTYMLMYTMYTAYACMKCKWILRNRCNSWS